MALRPDLPPLPARIATLPIDERGYPVPWFVAWIDGKPEFRVADADKRARAVREYLCWVCGQRLGTHLAFVLGPMCTVNRISAEPASHRDCAEFSVRACPFLAKPHMVRREGGIPEGADCAGEMIRRNPGCSAIWITRAFSLVPDGRGGWLVRVGEPSEVTWWAEGRTATRAEVLASIESGLPLLQKTCRPGSDDEDELAKLVERSKAYLPTE